MRSFGSKVRTSSSLRHPAGDSEFAVRGGDRALRAIRNDDPEVNVFQYGAYNVF